MVHNFFFSTTAKLLPKEYVTKERGEIIVKGKGPMTTCWLESKAGRVPPNKQEVSQSVSHSAWRAFIG
jgi:hypothetical protein